MASQYLGVDEHVLYISLELFQDFYDSESASERRAASKEIRSWATEYGFTPIARRRLQWEVARAEEAQEKRKRRKRADPKKDPRSQIKAVP
jgi:phage terminase small subunit